MFSRQPAGKHYEGEGDERKDQKEQDEGNVVPHRVLPPHSQESIAGRTVFAWKEDFTQDLDIITLGMYFKYSRY